MENKRESITFSPDFKQACDVFELDPWDVVQKFVDSVSLPYYFANPMNPDRWANTFMVECILPQMEDESSLERCRVFLDQITEAVLSDMDNKGAVSREVMDEWHKAVLEKRIQDIMEDKENPNTGED